MEIKGLVVLNGNHGNMRFEVGKRADAHPEKAKVTRIGTWNETNREHTVQFDNNERWIIYTTDIIVIEDYKGRSLNPF